MTVIWLIFIIAMGVIGRLSGNGFGKELDIAWLPEWLYAVPFGIAAAYGANQLGFGNFSFMVFVIGTLISYGGMQSATWYFLRWESHDDPNTERSGTLKPIVDLVSKLFGYKIGDEGYAWIGAAVKGFIIGLPVGGFITALLWPLGYEIGSHAKGRVEKFGIKDSHAVSEFLSAAGGGISIVIFIEIIKGL